MSEVELEERSKTVVDEGPESESTVRYQTGDEVATGELATPATGPAFVHLAVHSEYSVSDGLVKVRDLAARVAELGMPAVALTDRANLFGLVKFYKACREAGVKALVGADLDYEDSAAGGRRLPGPGGFHNRVPEPVASRVGSLYGVVGAG